jgi:hypothetical protein
MVHPNQAATVFCVIATATASCGGGSSHLVLDGGSSEGSGFGRAPTGPSSGDSSSEEPSSSGGLPSEAGPPTLSPGPFRSTVEAGPPTCTPTIVGGTGGPGECEVEFGETCGGTGYHATCACPQGTCACLGPSTTVIHFTGCPGCPSDPRSGASPSATTIAQVFARCGFPY